MRDIVDYLIVVRQATESNGGTGTDRDGRIKCVVNVVRHDRVAAHNVRFIVRPSEMQTAAAAAAIENVAELAVMNVVIDERTDRTHRVRLRAVNMKVAESVAKRRCPEKNTGRSCTKLNNTK